MRNNENKILKSPLILSVGILFIGILFKVHHYPYANLIVVFGFSSIAILYLLRFLYKKPKKLIDFLKLLLVLFWTINGILSLLHFPYNVST